MKNINRIILILIYATAAYSQPEFKNNVYSRTSKLIEKDFQPATVYNDSKIVHSKLLFSTYELLCIGEYNNSISKFDKMGTSHFSFIDSINHYKEISDYFALPAKYLILQQAKSTHIVIINENHNQPLHRIFAKSLLKDLYAQGYHYLAIEALISDTSLNKKNRPTLNTGYYTIEPQFSNMLKEAMDIGYTFISYDVFNKKREYYQALNIKEKVFDKDTSAKVFIYCGFDHVSEKIEPDSSFMMAGWLKLLTKINPLTIDQVCLTEHSSKDFEKTSYSLLNARSSSVFVNKKDSTHTFIPFDAEAQCDMYVYHPKTIFKNKRPNWLTENNESHEYKIPTDSIHIKYRLLVMAYSKDEKIDVNIPTDAIELQNAKDIKPLNLKAGSYRLLLRNDLKQMQIIDAEIK